jgi:hypothetical protein
VTTAALIVIGATKMSECRLRLALTDVLRQTIGHPEVRRKSIARPARPLNGPREQF